MGLEDLEILETYHEEKSISAMAGKLKELITTNIAVMAHNKRVCVILSLIWQEITRKNEMAYYPNLFFILLK